MTRNLSVEAELSGLRADIDALLQRVDRFTVGDRPTEGVHVMFAEMDVTRKLIEARTAIEKLAESAHVELERIKVPIRQCQCEEANGQYVIMNCPIHAVDHVYTTGCCDQSPEVHRHPTSTEYETMYPRIYERKFSVGDETYLLDARRFPSGDGVTLTCLLPDHLRSTDEADEGFGGLCFDFPREIVPELIKSLQELDLTEPA